MKGGSELDGEPGWIYSGRANSPLRGVHMTLWILGLALLTTTQSTATSQDPCSPGRAVRLVSNVIPALGQSPIWAATGGKPLAWENATTPIRVLAARRHGQRAGVSIGAAGQQASERDIKRDACDVTLREPAATAHP